jgi:prepilin-type N-terminal cleavage/methylation domain-containing protein
LKKAFSLIELMIVILIIGIVYTLAISKFQKIADGDVTKVSLSNLREYLQKFPHAKSVQFICLDDCSKCNVFVDDKIQEELKGVFDNFIDDSIKVYRYDFTLGAVAIEPDSFFNIENVEERVCFSYRIGQNNIGEQVLVSFKDKIYDYTSYFGQTVVYDSMDELVQQKEKQAQEIIR